MNKCEQCIVREMNSLKALTPADLIKMSQCKTSHTIKKGELIFEEGENVNGVYCIKDGVCKMTKLSQNGKSQIVKLVKRGEFLGQRSMLSDEPANLSAVALDDMQVCFIPKNDLLGFFNQNNNFSMNIVKDLCGDLKSADDLMVDMAQKTVRERLAHVLLYIEDTFGTNVDNSLKLQLSREEIAGMIGTATESCIRLLSDLRKENVIALSGKIITILDRDNLVRAAN